MLSPSLESITDKIKICKKCSVLAFNSNSDFYFFAKPSIFTQPSTRTFYLSLELIDTVCQNIVRSNTHIFEVYGTCCFLLAYKYIEVDPSSPDYSDFKCFDGMGYIPHKELANYEVIIYRLDVVTAYDVLGVLFHC